MSPFGFSAEQAADELKDLHERFERLRASAAAIDLDANALPRKLIYQEGNTRLYQYQPAKRRREPVIICYAMVNRPDILALHPDRSLIGGLLDKGHPVYLVDWGDPEPTDRYRGLSDYIVGTLDRCVTRICRRHRRPSLSLLGVCEGGVFALCYAALRPHRISKLVTLVTPVNFHAPQMKLRKLTENVDVDLMVETLGNVPGSLLSNAFVAFDPFKLRGTKYLQTLSLEDDDKALADFLRMERWLNDCPNHPGEAFREFMQLFFRDNRLLDPAFKLGANQVSLNNLDIPILNVIANHDHLVPPESSRALRTCIKEDKYHELEFDTGHIGIFVSKKFSNRVPKAISEWLEKVN